MVGTMKFCALLALLALGAVHAAEVQEKAGERALANPIRKVVTMMQMMQNKITAEGKKEEELMEKFLCYCATSSDTLAKSIEDAKTKIPQLESDIKEMEAMKAQLAQDIEDAKTSRADAKAAMEKATALREKENK